MMQSVQSTDTAIDFGRGRPVALKKKWVVAPAGTTAIVLDHAVKHKSESDSSALLCSLLSVWMAESEVVENIYQADSDYDQNLALEMLKTVDHTVLRSDLVSTDSSTPLLDFYSRHAEAQAVKYEIERLFSLATFIDLEPGMTNSFSEGLEQVIERHGSRALDAIKRIILNEETASSIAMEALKYIGNTDSSRWHNERRLMIEDCLRSSHSAWVRDGAGLGLSSLDNPRSIPAIERAIAKESSKALKEDLKLVLNQLKRTIGA